MPRSITVPLRSARVLTNLGVATGFAVVVGVAAVVGELAGRHSTGERVIGVGLGVVLLVAGAAFGAAFVAASRTRTLVADDVGLHWHAARDGWTVRWPELSSVAVHVGWSTGAGGRRRYRVHLTLTGADPGFRQRHPQFATTRSAFFDSTEEQVGIPFADRRDLVAPFDVAFRTFAGDRYGGVVDDGHLRRPGYRPEG